MWQILDGEAVEKSARQRLRQWLVVRLPSALQSEGKTHQSPLCPAVPTAGVVLALYTQQPFFTVKSEREQSRKRPFWDYIPWEY